MHPKDHPLFDKRNMLELLFQSPIWLILYGTGLIFIVSAISWAVYGLGWHIHPKRYPLPHVMLLELLATTMIWVRNESDFTEIVKKNINIFLAFTSIVLIPLLFLLYAKYLFWMWVVK